MSHTPAMQQYYDLKAKYKDSILFFRMGDFYEMFDNDALIANKVLGIAITTRNKNATEPTPLAGIPFHSKEKYLPQFIQAGYKVAIAEQVSDPKLKGIVQREVVRVVTPATLGLESEGFDTENSNILAISSSKKGFGLSIIDISTNKWQTCEFPSFFELKTELYKLSPKEVVLEKSLFANEEIRDTLEKKYALNIYFFEDSNKSAYKNLTLHFQTNNLKGFGIEGFENAISASSLLLEYLKTHQKESFDFLHTISYLNTSHTLQIDESTIANLDLVYNFATKSEKEGTLFGLLDKTKTRMGKSYLYESILKPSKNKEEIEKRHTFIEAFLEDIVLLEKTRKELGHIANINNILNRIALNRTTPRDLIQLKNSLKSLLKVIELIEKEGNTTLQKILKK